MSGAGLQLLQQPNADQHRGGGNQPGCEKLGCHDVLIGRIASISGEVDQGSDEQGRKAEPRQSEDDLRKGKNSLHGRILSLSGGESKADGDARLNMQAGLYLGLYAPTGGRCACVAPTHQLPNTAVQGFIAFALHKTHPRRSCVGGFLEAA